MLDQRDTAGGECAGELLCGVTSVLRRGKRCEDHRHKADWLAVLLFQHAVQLLPPGG